MKKLENFIVWSREIICTSTFRQHTSKNTIISSLAVLLQSSSSLHPSIHPSTRLPRGALAPRLGCKYLCEKIKKQNKKKKITLMLEKLTPKKKRKPKKNAEKKMLSWKARIFSGCELSVLARSIPGCLRLSSFGSLALQFSFTSWLEASEAPLALHAASKKARGVETKTDTEWAKSSLSCKNNLRSHTWALLSLVHALPSVPPSLSSVCSIFWCVVFFFPFFPPPAIQFLPLYNLQ